MAILWDIGLRDVYVRISYGVSLQLRTKKPSKIPYFILLFCNF